MASRNIVLENATLLGGQFRNFSGRGGPYNREGDRNFAVQIEPELAQTLTEEGWNVHSWESPNDADEDPVFFLKVAVSFANVPPKVVVITGQGKKPLSEDTIGVVLDNAIFENVDLVISPYNWEVNGKTGVKAYLRSMYATVVEDELAAKYYDIPDAQD